MIDAQRDNNPRYELRHIRTFVAVAEERHFRRAAERLNVGQPAVTRTIKWLEAAVGARLFERTTRQVDLTPSGQALLDECRRALAAFDRGVRRARQAAVGEAGRLVVAYMDFAINGPLPRIIERFRRACPDVEVSLFHMPTSIQREALAEGDIDIAFLIGPFEQEGFEVLEVARDPLLALVPSDHPLADRPRLSVRELVREPLVIGSPEAWAAYRMILERIFTRLGVRPHVVQEASTSDGILGLVAAKMGVTLYPSCALALQREGVVIRPLTDRLEEVPTLAAWPTKSPNPSVTRFVTFLTDLHPCRPG
jgi:DNA-binding transcriptional LysR family regulator